MRILVAGVGNIFLGDDGFGVAVARRLARQQVPGDVVVTDFGIRGVHLAYEITGGGYDCTILVDAVSKGDPPGTLYLLRPTPGDTPATFVDAHDMTPDAVLALAGTLGGEIGKVLLVGCEPADVSPGMVLSPPVAEAVDRAVELLLELIPELTPEQVVEPVVEPGSAPTPAPVAAQIATASAAAGDKEERHGETPADADGAGGGRLPGLPVHP